MQTLNIHPIFVHFPIALLTIYALMELLRLSLLQRQHWWFHTKAVILCLGTLGSFAAYMTGDMAEDGFRGTPTMALVHMHSLYATATVWVFAILSVLYLVEWLAQEGLGEQLPSALQTLWKPIRAVQAFLFRAPLLIIAALVGLALVTITGALGGALVYGPDVDPIVSFIYHLVYKP